MRRLLLLLLTVATGQAAQIIPVERTFNESWQNSGYPGRIPSPAKIVNVRDFHTTNDFAAVIAAIHSLSNAPGVVYLPAGTYLFHTAINLPPGVVLRGESSATTTLRWDNLGYCINVTAAQKEQYQPVTGGYTIHSRSLDVTDSRAFAVDDYAEIREDNDPAWGASKWAAQTVGQILRITAITGKTLTLERPLRITYQASQNPVIRKINPVTEVGIENLKIDRAIAGTDTARANIYTVFFNYAARCWMRGVESANTFGGHIAIDHSTQISVTSNYFHHAWFYGGGGSGYGVRLQYQTGECRIEDNIFQHLRHSMLVQLGANGNVFGYNYSCEPLRTEFPSEVSSDITVHGNYPYANLFEGNLCQHIWIDDSHNANGPLNTFFRNRAESYGIYMTDHTASNQNFVGNETFTGKLSLLFNPSGYRLIAGGHFEYGNVISGKSIQPPGTTNLTDCSYYLTNVTGVTLPTEIPARARHLAGKPLTILRD
ncbi:MAG: glycosyl hydrolase family 28-related protein [Verrucomicrobiota bacterium]